MLFVISEDLSSIEKIESQSFVDLNVWERKHIQEWVRRHPEILGDDLLIVSMEFDRFEGSRDRLDLLAIDRSGNLVVVELKRDPFAGYADLQSIRYAAMVSTMTIDQLLGHYAVYHKNTMGEDASTEELRIKLNEFVELDEFEELSSRPRIILCSEDFSQEITTTVLWLRRFDLDISCVRLTPHRSDSKIVLVPEKIIPLRESEQYIISVQEKEEKRQASGKGKSAATLEELQARADKNGTGEGFRAILQAAEGNPELSFRTTPFLVRITPASNRNNSLCVIGPSSSAGEGLSINVYSEIWAKFFGVDGETLASTLGPDRYREGVTHGEAKEFAASLDYLLENIKGRTEAVADTESIERSPED